MISPKERGHSCPHFPFHAAKLPNHHEADKSVRAPFSFTAHHHRFAMKPSSSLHHSITPPLRACLLVAFLLSSFAIPHSSFGAESPLYIPFQGQVTNQAGTIVADGQYSVIFNLYDQAVGGQPVWSERHVKIGVTRGMINVFLGSISPLTSVDFSQTKYLGITVDTDNLATTADPEMVPRSLIIPAFYAKKTEKMMAFDATSGASLGTSFGWSAIFNNGNPATGRIEAGKLVDSSITNTQLAAGAVTFGKIATAAVSNDNLTANSVTSDKIANGAVIESKLGSGVGVPVGSMFAYSAPNPPPGYLVCDGTPISRTTFSILFAVIGTTYGDGSTNPDGSASGFAGTHFNLPDFRGRFLRGWDNRFVAAGNRDPDVAGRTPMNPGGNGAYQIGSVQGHQITRHSHESNFGFDAGANGPGRIIGSAAYRAGSGTIGYSVASPGSRADISTETGGNETRPINAAVNYIIKH
ncbi:MAG: tail fiber protein [Verrucomicrobiaceae bacterium]|nr:tail fiber protein [Verrucomicrobiaceae bacterium]